MSGVATLPETVAVGLPYELIRDYLGRLPLLAPALRNRLDDIVSDDHDGRRRPGGRDCYNCGAVVADNGLDSAAVDELR
jgi:hypothetical protein